METPQAQVSVPANPDAGAQAQIPANGGVSSDLQQFVEPATAPGNDPQAQAQVQSTGATPDPNIVELQRKLNERQIREYQLNQELERMRQQQPVVQPPAGNPFDASTQQAQWWSWEKNDMARLAAEQARQSTKQEFGAFFGQISEAQWSNQHPGVDIQQVKAFQQMRGIRDINDAYTLMNLPNQLNSVAQNTAQQALNNFRQPTQIGATPLRGTQGAAPGTIQLRFQDMLKAQAEDSNFITRFPQEVQDAFWRESYAARTALK